MKGEGVVCDDGDVVGSKVVVDGKGSFFGREIPDNDKTFCSKVGERWSSDKVDKGALVCAKMLWEMELASRTPESHPSVE